ncbi:MAG: VCBS repeat-containing protein [Balneolaceae bacterium]|nr:VCBS repeat-containing protein [Balneolaceae bacterium]
MTVLLNDVAPDLGVASLNTPETGVSMGSVWGDFDNDDYEDLLVYKWGRSVLFHNDEGNGFTNVSDSIEFPEWANINSAIWFDYDNDGHLDLFMGGYFHQSVDLWNLEDTKMMPESFEYANNGGRKYLFHNEGDGTFKEVSRQMGIESNRWALAASSADLSGDGYPDLVIANDYGVDELYINKDGTGFTESGSDAGMGFSPKSGMNVSFGDILNQGGLLFTLLIFLSRVC